MKLCDYPYFACRFLPRLPRQQLKLGYALTICLALIPSIALLSGCHESGPNTIVGATGGAVVGAGAGAIVGNQTGSSATGAIIGGAGGAVVGGALGASRDAANKATASEDEFILRQKKRMEQQRNEIEDLQRQKYHDDYYRSRYGSDTADASPNVANPAE